MKKKQGILIEQINSSYYKTDFFGIVPIFFVYLIS